MPQTVSYAPSRPLGLLCLVAALATGCDDGADPVAPPSAPPPPQEPPDGPVPFEELYEQGVDRYLGVFTPTSSDESADGVVHRFEGEDGPRCYTGDEFHMATRDGAGDELMIFLQGGGLCAPGNCSAIESWPPGIPPFGLLNPEVVDNPTADYDLGYVPYCDGSLFTGDRDVDVDGDGTIDRSFRGLENLSASLDVIQRAYPAPRKIFLAGNSAGGFAVHFALPLVRALYPGVAIELVNDSGIPILPPDILPSWAEYWGGEAFYPASCGDCAGESGDLSAYYRYQLDEDPDLRMGFISSRRDETGSGAVGAEAFEAGLLEVLGSTEAAHPDRVRSMIADDDSHTFILRQFEREVGGRTVKHWLGDMLSGGDAWVSVAD